jgi:hypothetical protein
VTETRLPPHKKGKLDMQPIHLIIKAREVTAREWSTGEIEKPAKADNKKRRALNIRGRTFGKKGS